MYALILAVVLILAGVLFFWLGKKKRERDDRRRILNLYAQARKLFPNAENDIERLDLLWQEIYRGVVKKRNNGQDISDDLSDSILIWNERMRLIRKEVEREIGFNQGRHRKGRNV